MEGGGGVGPHASRGLMTVVTYHLNPRLRGFGHTKSSVSCLKNTHGAVDSFHRLDPLQDRPMSSMSGHQQLAPRQGKRPQGGGGSSISSGQVKVYLHAVTDEQAALLTDKGGISPLEDIKKKSGADVDFDLNPSPVPGMKIVIVRGVSSQIEAAVRDISQKTGAKGRLSDQAQTFWLQWVEAAFPDLDSRAYFLPPVYFNRVPVSRQPISGRDVYVLESTSVHPSTTSQPPHVQDSDVRDDAAMQRIFVCLQKMFEENSDAMVGLTQLQFGKYLGEPCYAAAATRLPISFSLPPSLPRNWKQGDFDFLLIHRQYGLVVCEVKAIGDNIKTVNMSQQDLDKKIRQKLGDTASQLDKAEAMLCHLVSDIAPGLGITKVIVFPNLTAYQLQQAISGDNNLIQTLGRCLKTTTDPAVITSLCLCCDQLSDPKTPYDVSSHVLRELGDWWQRRVAGPLSKGQNVTLDVYKGLVARFCGPATTVTVPCTSVPRLSVKTMSEAVSMTGECYTAVITLFPEQVHLLHTSPARIFVTGPPGTGKTVVLLLTGIKWLQCGHPVYIVSTCDESRTACSMLYHLMLHTGTTQQSASQLMLMDYRLYDDEDLEMAVEDLSQAAIDGSLYVIADEAGTNFKTLCDKLLTQVPDLHLWAASCLHGDAPAGWQVEYLTRPLRFPPAVVREVEQNELITDQRVQPYSERGVPDPTDGPPVRRLCHGGQDHDGDSPGDCVTCGREVASLLHSLRVGVTENVTTTSTTLTSCTTPPCLQWRDVLVLYWLDVISDNSGMVEGLNEAGIPVQMMEDDDIDDVATALSDVVWVARGDRVHGLERKVIVCLYIDDVYIRLNVMSRCTSQLVIVS